MYYIIGTTKNNIILLQCVNTLKIACIVELMTRTAVINDSCKI